MQRKNNKTRYFLIELIANCFFFALAAIICVNFFAIGFTDNKNSKELSQATLKATEMAEVFKAYANDVQMVLDYTGATKTDDGYEVYYDKDWKQVESSGEYSFVMDVGLSITQYNTLVADIEINSEEGSVYSLTVSKFLEGGV